MGEEAEDGSCRAIAAAAAIHPEAETLEELHREIRDAVLCHVDPGRRIPCAERLGRLGYSLSRPTGSPMRLVANRSTCGSCRQASQPLAPGSSR